MPKQVPPIAASKQRTMIITTAVVPPAAIKAPSSLTAAMVTFTALTVASAAFFAVFAVALAVTLAECSAFLAAFAVTSALFFATSVLFCAVFICLDVFSTLLALCFIPASADLIVLSPERTLRISRFAFCFGADCLRVRGLDLSLGLSSLTVFALDFVCCFLSATDFFVSTLDVLSVGFSFLAELFCSSLSGDSLVASICGCSGIFSVVGFSPSADASFFALRLFLTLRATFLVTVAVPLTRFSAAFLPVSVTLSVAYCSGEGLSSFETSCFSASSSVLDFAFDTADLVNDVFLLCAFGVCVAASFTFSTTSRVFIFFSAI